MAYDMKNEEDVKEFIDNLGIEYRFGCFSEKKPQSTFLFYIFVIFIFFYFQIIYLFFFFSTNPVDLILR